MPARLRPVLEARERRVLRGDRHHRPVKKIASRVTKHLPPVRPGQEASMGTTKLASGTTVSEISAGIYRISTAIPPSAMPGGFTFNQFLVVDEAPLLFHTGSRRMFPLVR